jgi:hypothetical protein
MGLTALLHAAQWPLGKQNGRLKKAHAQNINK